MIYKIPFINRVPEEKFEKDLCWYITTDNTFNSANNFTFKCIDDQIVVFEKERKIVTIDKDDQYITLDIDNEAEDFEIYQQIKEMVQAFIIDRY